MLGSKLTLEPAPLLGHVGEGRDVSVPLRGRTEEGFVGLGVTGESGHPGGVRMRGGGDGGWGGVDGVEGTVAVVLLVLVRRWANRKSGSSGGMVLSSSRSLLRSPRCRVASSPVWRPDGGSVSPRAS